MATNQQIAYGYFLGKGLSPAQSAGIVGNLQAESGLDPEQVNSLGCFGIAQWCFGRGPASLKTGNPQQDFQNQLDYMWTELNGSESHALTAVKGTSSPQQAAAVFEAAYERSGGALLAQRESYAAQILSEATSGNWGIVDLGSSSGSSATSATPASTASNPLAYWDRAFKFFFGGGASGITDTVSFVVNLLHTLTSRTFWLRVGEIFLGTGLLFAGLWLMAQESKTVQQAESAASLAAAA